MKRFTSPFTETVRLFLVKKWYGTHNMHPYQNLTKSLKKHKFTTLISIL